MTTAKLSHRFLAGGGEMAELMLHVDWPKTPWGPDDPWPQSADDGRDSPKQGGDSNHGNAEVRRWTFRSSRREQRVESRRSCAPPSKNGGIPAGGFGVLGHEQRPPARRLSLRGRQRRSSRGPRKGWGGY